MLRIYETYTENQYFNPFITRTNVSGKIIDWTGIGWRSGWDGDWNGIGTIDGNRMGIDEVLGGDAGEG